MIHKNVRLLFPHLAQIFVLFSLYLLALISRLDVVVLLTVCPRTYSQISRSISII